MNEQPSLTTQFSEFESAAVTAADRRTAPRINCHTVVTAVSEDDRAGDQLQIIKAYSEDVSVGGARIVSPEPLTSGRLFLRFLLPTFGDRYIEAEIVSQNERERRALTGGKTKQFIYGVRFTGVMADAEMIARIAPPPDDQGLE